MSNDIIKIMQKKLIFAPIMTVTRLSEWQQGNVRQNKVLKLVQNQITAWILHYPKTLMKQLQKHTRPPKIQKTISFKACNSEKESPSAIKDSEITCDSALHATVDSLINEFKEFKIRSCESRKESQQNPLFAVNGKVYEKTAQLLLNWPDVKNIPRPGVRMQTY